MTVTDPDEMLLLFPSLLSQVLWNFSEDANLPLGEFAPLIFGLAIGAGSMVVIQIEEIHHDD